MSNLLTEQEVAKVTGYEMLSKQCEVLAAHGVFFVKDRNGCPHVTWHCLNNPAHLRLNNRQAHYDPESEPDFSSMV